MLGTQRGKIAVVSAAVALVAAATYAIAPAVGGSGAPLTKKKAKKLFFTRALAELRFLDPAEGDGRYLSRSAQTRINLAPTGWVFSPATFPNSLTFDYHPSSMEVSGDDGEAFFADRPLDLPVTLSGQALRLASVEVCFDTILTSRVTDLNLQHSTHTTGVPSGSPLVSDPTDRTNNACVTIAPPAPEAIGSNELFDFQLRGDFTADNGILEVGRVSVTLVP
jgi:hypothetical protein